MIIQEEEKIEIIDDKKENTPLEEKTSSKKEKKTSIKVLTYVLIFFIVILALLLILFIGFCIYSLNHNTTIAKGVYIYGIDVSGLTKSEAKEKVSEKFDEFSKKDIELVNNDYKTYLNASEINLEYDIDSSVNYAFDIGKGGNIFADNYQIFETLINGKNISPTYTLSEEALTSYLQNLSKDLPNAVVESSYYTEDSKLVITKGTDGYIVNVDQTSKDIISSIKDFSYLDNSVQLSLTPQEAKKINLDEIYKEIYKEPQDAYYTKNPYKVYPSSTGVDFSISLDEAKKLLENSDSEIEIKLKTTYPKVTTNMIGQEAFPDLLASFSTNYYTGNTNRVTNLKLAANKINGCVLLPDEIFSYNGVVGKRTIAAGYKEASVYSNGQEVMGLGGGICQISTTLFNAALFANLSMVEVHNHQFIPQYSSAGRDATVVYGTKDFKFKNTRNYAIKITCSVSGGVANFKIWGVKESNEPEVGVYVNTNSKTASYTKTTTYRTLKQNGQTISTEKIYSCTYKPH